MKIKQPESKKQIINRLKRIEGQIRGIALMVEKDEECMKIAEQLSACKAALSQTLNTFAVCAIEESSDRKNKLEEIRKILQVVK